MNVIDFRPFHNRRAIERQIERCYDAIPVLAEARRDKALIERLLAADAKLEAAQATYQSEKALAREMLETAGLWDETRLAEIRAARIRRENDGAI